MSRGELVRAARPLPALPPAPETARFGVSPRDLLHVLFRRKWWLAAFFGVTLLTALVASLALQRELYLATAQVLISPGREHVSDVSLATAGKVEPRFSFNIEEQTERATQLLTGRVLVEHVVKTIGPEVLYPEIAKPRLLEWLIPALRQPWPPEVLLDEAVTRFIAGIVIEPAGHSSIITVGFKHEDPELAAEAVNLLTDLYIERHLGVLKDPRNESFFEQQFKGLQGRLQEAQERLSGLKQRHGVALSVKDEMERTQTLLTSATSALADTRKQQSELDNRIGELRAQLSKTSTSSGAIELVRQKLTALELEEQEMAIRMTDANPSLRAVRNNIRSVREKLAKMEADKPYGAYAANQGTLFGVLQEEMLRAEAQRKGLVAREQQEVVRLADYQKRLDELKQIEVEFGQLQQQVQSDQDSYRLYQTKLEESRISDAMDQQRIASVRVIERAAVPLVPLASKTPVILALAALFGLGGGIALVLLLHRLGGRMDTPHEVERCLGLPVLATIPELPLR